ncbi:GSCFA domain-containing protein [Flavobacterium okayamense]|uniref:GSCFA domain-containing protein n=1 Tax=Flavobacterium okayamense TaxID=2830782 RepID=A0ABM7S4F2_9FLAO|nr:GSCFA domain-containing protein [Flavobacterium okayamense]BCY28391.1 hypothetical protein KK2020170_12590 [Flavobacterium okayamense]
MLFRTEIPITKSDFLIDYHSKVLLLGSCFAENIGKKFNYYKFQTSVNPFGIIFNTVSLEKLIKRVVEKNYFTENDLFYHNDLWHCYEVHSELSNTNKEEFLNNLNSIIDLTNKQITELTHCFITLGTSWVYRNNESSEIVANCHKVPQKEFTKELLSTKQIEESLQNIVTLIHSINPNVKFVFTVSPVRHIKDGFFENNVSKGNLFSAIQNILSHRAESRCYFPSYEIVMDELRDYRFFEKDMLHPNQLAIDYIWEKLSFAYFSSETVKITHEIDSIQKGLAHKPFNPNTESHLKFVNNLQSKIKELNKKYHFLNFS